MSNVQVRLPQRSIKEIDQLGNRLGSKHSDVIRKVLNECMSLIKAELSLKDYIGNKITLCKATLASGISIAEFAEYATRKRHLAKSSSQKRWNGRTTGDFPKIGEIRGA